MSNNPSHDGTLTTDARNRLGVSAGTGVNGGSCGRERLGTADGSASCHADVEHLCLHCAVVESLEACLLCAGDALRVLGWHHVVGSKFPSRLGAEALFS